MGVGAAMMQRPVVVEQPDTSKDENKYQRAMDWGTPRLVTKNR